MLQYKCKNRLFGSLLAASHGCKAVQRFLFTAQEHSSDATMRAASPKGAPNLIGKRCRSSVQTSSAIKKVRPMCDKKAVKKVPTLCNPPYEQPN